jgi:LCP family protein required for cell wall assembly
MNLRALILSGEHHKPRFVLEILFLIFNLFILTGILGKSIWRRPVGHLGSPGESMVKTGNSGPVRLNVLCVGVDSVEGTHRTDTVLLAGVNVTSGDVHLVSIPRDTRVVIAGKSRKINEVFARHGMEMLRMVVEEMLEIRIGRFVKLDFQGFTKVIDAIGGIDLYIDQPMHYDDNWGKLHIHFDRGQTHLDGQKALEFVRFRGGPTADLGRIKRQQRFIAAILEKLYSPGIVLKIPEILGDVFSHLQTDFELSEVLEIAQAFRGRTLKIQTESLPGDARYVDKVSYFIPNASQAVELGGRWFSELISFELEASFTPKLSTGTLSP